MVNGQLSMVHAQVVIGGNVYGGGNEGNVNGKTTVTVREGDIDGSVFGGARQANVGGRAFVNIDGENMSGDIIINRVYGGNDIAGTIGTSAEKPFVTKVDTIDNTYNAFVLMTREKNSVTDSQGEITSPYSIFIGQIFGGGNGEYDYSEGSDYEGKQRPELAKTYIEIDGGSAVLVYGGGNNATVTQATDICINDSGKITNHIYERDENGDAIEDLSHDLLNDNRLKRMGVYQLGGAGENVANSPEYHFSRVFGGNCVADMSIRPSWHLEQGKIRKLFSGGNRGAMTHPQGIVMVVNPTVPEKLIIGDIYGGCRMADVNPAKNEIHASTINGIFYPKGFASRLNILGGIINNVYGGNDISGTVWGGCAVGIHTSIKGDVYGGGNGSYPYTDNDEFKNIGTNADEKGVALYGDYYYDPDEILAEAGIAAPADEGMKSALALNEFRPHAESVSIRVGGNPSETAEHPTIIGGAIYCGGNSATLRSSRSDAKAELKIGSNVYADKVFLGSNGENMISETVLQRLYGNVEIDGTEYDFSQMNLTDAEQMAAYMKGCELDTKPIVVFDNTDNGDPTNYTPYSTYFGSFFCGGNVGSVYIDDLENSIDFNHNVIIFNKLVGGCNNAYVPARTYNAAYDGGVLTDNDVNATLTLNLSGLKLQPKRWKNEDDKSQLLEWNTYIGDEKNNPTSLSTGNSTSDDLARRFKNGSVYGGCYTSGHVEANIVININGTIVDREGPYGVFDTVEKDASTGREIVTDGHYSITERRSGVILHEQAWDVMGTALTIFGGGYGVGTEIWGSTTINLNKGYAFQMFGGGEEGAIGKKDNEGEYAYNDAYSTTVNLKGNRIGQLGEFDDMAVCEYMYGGSFEGLIAGDTRVNLGNGRLFSSFGGSCNADILGHAETFVGRSGDSNNTLGYPYIIDNLYGGNDLGGRIYGSKDFIGEVDAADLPMIHGGSTTLASSYVEFLQGHVDEIYGGCYGVYDYTQYSGVEKPFLDNAFVNIRPTNSNDNVISRGVFGAGQGITNERDGDKMQNRSYVLIDIPGELEHFSHLEVFGAGSFDGLGMGLTKAEVAANPDNASAIIDLIQGKIDAVFGASYNEGFTRRTVVNIPAGSTIRVKNIFGGAYGLTNTMPCDAYEANVNFNSSDALVTGAVYGGNNNARRTFYSKVNVNSTVYSNRERGYQATVYGAGNGANTWSEYTEVNLNDGATVYEVYGGGNAGRVLNEASVAAWKKQDGTVNTYFPSFGDYDKDTDTGLNADLVNVNPLGKRTNTNVYINKGAYVGGYCYGGGYGETAVVSGTTYIGLHGGMVFKDLYAGGTSGSVMNAYEPKNNTTFTAETNAFIEGGSTRNVYGGGWKGSVGKHEGDISTSTNDDIEGVTNVVIGIRGDQASIPAGYGYYKGVPIVQRNAYAGGEGGAVYGTANLIINNGYIGYVYNADSTDDPETEIDDRYEEKLNDETWTDHIGLNRLLGSGNAFGGGYVDNSSVDSTNVVMWGGWIRNSLFGGGEIAAIGRGTVTVSGYQNSVRTHTADQTYKPGKTHVEMYNGHVLRDVFGGGKGYNNLGEIGSLYTDGYVFGQTEVFIRGGEIGTSTNYEQGYGNVFGGGDLGYVYGIGQKSGKETDSPGHYYYTVDGGNDSQWTEDCKVVVEPYAQVINAASIDINGTTYYKYDYVPTDTLNKLKGKDDSTDGVKWAALDDHGIIIYNAVFAGGNVADGSDKVYANTSTVFGNATASLRDIYRRDLITIGTEHIGGLYGGGNLALVDGYRELHISNYGTDYYGLQQQIDMDQYNRLTERERAYFRLRFTCIKAFDGGKDDEGIAYNGHQVGDQIYEDEYNDLPDNLQTDEYWTEDGVCSIYAGRLLNTLQRADFVGVFGSRMVLQGARDRVTSVADYTRYTINRVGEVSLMKTDSPADEADDTNKSHGNYFGIYSGVKYLGNLTSDVLMTDIRQSDTNDTDNETTYAKWKQDHPSSRKRNTATSHNEVALASGVFLELTTEKSTEEKKDYGYITGVVELDLINAVADVIGGGYVYAKNEHGKREEIHGYDVMTLSDYNDAARTYKQYRYNHDAGNLQMVQTSGNFVHDSRKTIVDDCYPHNLEYTPNTEKFSDAHYWYIKGSIYIYDQVISAFTGAPTAYTRETIIPLTITPGSHGELKLVNVQPNLYAYWANKEHTSVIDEEGVKVGSRGVNYNLNDVITYWDWSQLSADEQALFVPETIVSLEECTYTNNNGQTITLPQGTVMLANDYQNFKTILHTKTIEGKEVHYVHSVKKDRDVEVDDVFHTSNNVSRNTGYVVSFEMDTPPDWNKWYSEKTGTSKINTPTYNDKTDSEKDNYIAGPTFSTSTTGVYGQRKYDKGEIIPNDVVSKYVHPGTNDQATVSRAYVTSEPVTYTYNGNEKSVNAGTPISKTEYDSLYTQDPAAYAKFKAAKICVNTLKLNDETYIIYGDMMNDDDIAYLAGIFADKAEDINNALTPAYICESGGLYGGTQYTAGTKYNAVDGWASLTSTDRAKNTFSFNNDAFDVLADPEYQGILSMYGHPYDQPKKVEYVAIYNDDEPLEGTVYGTITKGQELTRQDYEQLTNEKYNYSPVKVSKTAAEGDDFYIVKEGFSRGNMAYAKGQLINAGTYRALNTQERNNIDVLHFTNTSNDVKTYFYCRESHTSSKAVTNLRSGSNVSDDTSNDAETAVTAGWVISKDDYKDLKNEQQHFLIKGDEPTESTTLYVSRESNIQDLSKEKIISVIYQYTYNEGDDTGENVELVNEMHIVNIHLQFESGAPLIDPLLSPSIVLPGTIVGINQPKVTPGAYELIGGGWEIYDNKDDADFHRNGTEYRNNETPMYWYQNDYYVAYYAKSYVGKTFSNAVQFKVANYHDLKKVMDDKDHHYYIDHKDAHKLRAPKIYINNYSQDGENGLDMLSDLFKLSTGETVSDHRSVNTAQIGNCHDLEFFLRTDIQHPENWTSIGNATQCFSGILHGDGYTISGLDHSLFGSLCDNVYNLGVTGSFTGSGVADSGSGHVENCWVKTSGSTGTNKAVFGGTDVVNSYYFENQYTNGQTGTKAMIANAFNNGEVTYDLNGFYLKERYDRNKATAEAAINDQYVAKRFVDGDFIYAGGSIPDDDDERLHTDVETGDKSYQPLWPDDYIFFGQALNYNINELTHQPLPSRIAKSGNEIVVDDQGNRVLRAPAYYRDKNTMGVAHFNPYAVFCQEGQPNMTAIDFTGKNDLSGGYKKEWDDTEKFFFLPLLDDAGLTSFHNVDLTKNLLAYTSATGDTPAGKTAATVMNALSESEYRETSTTYRTVDPQDDLHTHGHWVQKSGDDFIATLDHFLVDRNDFCAPFSYQFTDDKRMWYQRMPDHYVGIDSKGWEVISLPFTAELVTTQDMGEITHFYSGSKSVVDNAKIGHEYWLRDYRGKDPEKNIENHIFPAVFSYPTKTGNSDDDKTVGNTFLWDHYYSNSNQLDENSDSYQRYYASTREYPEYPLLAAANAYIIGFPGKDYHEFDLSGEWDPKHTILPVPGHVAQQTITFASVPNVRIEVSYDEMQATLQDGYAFKTNYLGTVIPAGAYLLNSDGNSFEKTIADTTAIPFRPYFVDGSSLARPTTRSVQRISINNDGSSFDIGNDDQTEDKIGESVDIRPSKRSVVITSNLKHTADVRIFNVGGLCIANFDIEPGQTIKHPIYHDGVYVVHVAGGRYRMKLAVK